MVIKGGVSELCPAVVRRASSSPCARAQALTIRLCRAIVRHTVDVEQPPGGMPRVATAADAATVARLLDAFNREFDTPTPGVAILTTRLETLLAGTQVVALLAGDPAVAVAVLTLRPNVWYAGPVALLDELYVAPELRGRGMGSALLAAAETITRRRGGELLEINVDGRDTDARRFYERHGYTNTEEGDDQPLLYYYRELGDVSQRDGESGVVTEDR